MLQNLIEKIFLFLPWFNLLILAILILIAYKTKYQFINWLNKTFCCFRNIYPKISVGTFARPHSEKLKKIHFFIITYVIYVSIVLLVLTVICIMLQEIYDSLIIHSGININEIIHSELIPPTIIAILLALFLRFIYEWGPKLSNHLPEIALFSFLVGIIMMILSWLHPILTEESQLNTLNMIIGLCLTIIGPVGTLLISMQLSTNRIEKSITEKFKAANNIADLYYVMMQNEEKDELIDFARSVSDVFMKLRSEERIQPHENIVKHYIKNVIINPFKENARLISDEKTIDLTFHPERYNEEKLIKYMFERGDDIRMISYLSFRNESYWFLKKDNEYESDKYLKMQAEIIANKKTINPTKQFRRLIILREKEKNDHREILSTNVKILDDRLNNYKNYFGWKYIFDNEITDTQQTVFNNSYDFGIVNREILVENNLDKQTNCFILGYKINCRITDIEKRIEVFDCLYSKSKDYGDIIHEINNQH